MTNRLSRVLLSGFLVGMTIPASAASMDGYAQFRPAVEEVSAELSAGYAACIGRSSGVTEGMQNCIAEEYPRVDRKLNATYAQTMRRLPNEKSRGRLRQLQRAWLTERWVECTAEAAAAGGGSVSDIVYRNCQLREVARRTLWLKAVNS